MRVMGDMYVRDEFKRHKGAQASQAQVFMAEWKVSSEHWLEGGGGSNSVARALRSDGAVHLYSDAAM
ncbi:hypothetical protein CAOG_00419 [Capsaspora owczarzaki ATCC 30864]|uniref:hypothetical protein n=1 Tax=Capsaspora owczarzaki (strain ATCC 30864) TaxID=595528 RepID=UPI0001FE44C3|nr:hypothetical protein CAOG_00419 [Capsaspora owczarzaki ATCC 30864]|eukprot:XP_004365290.1 hypothetical protein CAOG_00419 [Capsaspora owczarzaki ATCC 30864]